AAGAQTPVYSLSSDTRTLGVNYTLLTANQGKVSYPVYLSYRQPSDELDVNWSDPIGIAPKTIKVTFNFPNPRVSAAALSTNALQVDGDKGTYAIKALDDLSQNILS